MTSRLKRKLNDVEPMSNNLNESFCMIGTPLPALADTKKDKGEFVPVWKQEVRDEQGRRRLHGAFTGGFSAGYFNTVGSKEGWVPSTFTSSRGQRAKKDQRAEDFMDEEDLMELKEGQKLETRQGFGLDQVGGESTNGKEAELSSFFTSLVQPSSSAIGETLLSKLGWRPGQGIGPRITARALRLAERKENPSLPQEELEEDPEAKKHLFAPRDTTLVVYHQKEGMEGLGWVKGGGLKKTDGKSLDEQNRFAYEDEDEDEEVMRLGSMSKASSAFIASSSTASSSISTWHDGRPVIKGFMVSSKPILEDKWFDPPPVPEGWQPRPSRVWNRGKKWDLTEAGEAKGKGKEKEVIDGEEAWRRRKAMTADDRAAVLGEFTAKPQESTAATVSSNAAKSVFDFMSAKDRERLASIADTKKTTSSAPARPILPVPKPLEIPTVDAVTANSALHGYMPFVDDPGRQARYRAYLSAQSTQTDPTNILVPQPGQSPSDHHRELSDFQQAAQIFRPLSFAMANRFTSSSQPIIEGPSAKAGLFVMTAEAKAGLAEAKAKREEEERQAKSRTVIPENETAMQQAARMGMYGSLTRETKPFFPVKLVCKRFGVADPHPEGPQNADDAGAFVDEGTATKGGAKPIAVDPNAWQSKFTHVVDRKPEQKEDTPPPVVDRPEAENAMYSRPSMDIFKAIFASDDEDSDSDEPDEGPVSAIVDPINEHSPTPAVVVAPSTVVAPPAVREASVLPPATALSSSLDPTSFRPTFTSKTDRLTITEEPSKLPSPLPAKDKGKKKKDKKRKAVLSFMDGEEEEAEAEEDQGEREKERERRRQEKKRRRTEEDALEREKDRSRVDEQDEWVEKLPSAVENPTVDRNVKRQRALDFM